MLVLTLLLVNEPDQHLAGVSAPATKSKELASCHAGNASRSDAGRASRVPVYFLTFVIRLRRRTRMWRGPRPRRWRLPRRDCGCWRRTYRRGSWGWCSSTTAQALNGYRIAGTSCVRSYFGYYDHNRLPVGKLERERSGRCRRIRTAPLVGKIVSAEVGGIE
jgi:hypothetical protein